MQPSNPALTAYRTQLWTPNLFSFPSHKEKNRDDDHGPIVRAHGVIINMRGMRLRLARLGAELLQEHSLCQRAPFRRFLSRLAYIFFLSVKPAPAQVFIV